MGNTLVCKWVSLSLMLIHKTLVNGHSGALHRRWSPSLQATRVNSELLPAVMFATLPFPQCKHPVMLSDGYSRACSPSWGWSKVQVGEQSSRTVISPGLRWSCEDLGLLANLQQKEAMSLSKIGNSEITYYYSFVFHISVSLLRYYCYPLFLVSYVPSLLASSCYPFLLFFCVCFFFGGECFFVNCILIAGENKKKKKNTSKSGVLTKN